MNNDYYENMNKINYTKLQTRLELLPRFCREYFIGIEMGTSILTRLNYARDFAIFFDYLINNVPSFKGAEASKLELTHLNIIEASDIEAYLSYLSFYKYEDNDYRNNEKAKARKLSSVRSLFKYFYNKGKLNQNVASKVSMPKLHEKEIVRLDNSEVSKLLSNIEKDSKFDTERQDVYNLRLRLRDTALITLLLGTGIRVSECVGLNIEDINIADKSFVITRKGGNRAILYFNDEVADALNNYLPSRKLRLQDKKNENESALFISLQNSRISVRAVENLVKKYAGTVTTLKKISPHKLRSTYGTALYRETKDIYVVAEVLGHKDVNTTKKHYAAISEDIKREASHKVTLKDK